MTITLIAASVFIAIRLQTSTAPQQTGAAGYGESADPTLFNDVTLAFSQTDCRFFVSEEKAIAGGYTEVAKLYAKARQQGKQFFPQNPVYPNPLNCLFTFDGPTAIQMKVVTYSSETVIDESPQALYTRVNNNTFEVVFDEGVLEGGYRFFYGRSSVTRGLCVSNIFQDINDFQTITLYYSGFDCEDHIALNEDLSRYIADEVSTMLSDTISYDPANSTFQIIEE